MAEGRFPLEGANVEPGPRSETDGGHLPDGRYRYEAIFSDLGGGLSFHSGVLFVRGGVASSRIAKQDELEQLRAGLLAEHGTAVTGDLGAEGSSVNDYVLILDGAQGSVTRVRLYSDGYDIVDLQNNFGDLVLANFNGSTSFVTLSGDTDRFGLGTLVPGEELDIAATFPSLRLSDVDGTIQTWDIEGNNFDFQVQDVTNGNAATFLIEPGTPHQTLHLDSTGRIGVGTSAPGQELHVFSSDGGDIRLSGSAQGELWDIGIDSGDGSLNFNDTNTVGNAVRIAMGSPNGSLTVSPAGVGIGTFAPTAKLHVAGSGRIDGDVALGSSRTLKTGFGRVSPTQMLARVADLPVASWRYKSEDEAKRHIGPFAEDFQRLFGLGDGETISVIDAQGVTLAAIQGLQQELVEKDAQISDLTTRLVALEARSAAGDARPSH